MFVLVNIVNFTGLDSPRKQTPKKPVKSIAQNRLVSMRMTWINLRERKTHSECGSYVQCTGVLCCIKGTREMSVNIHHSLALFLLPADTQRLTALRLCCQDFLHIIDHILGLEAKTKPYSQYLGQIICCSVERRNAQSKEQSNLNQSRNDSHLYYLLQRCDYLSFRLFSKEMIQF